MGNNVGRYLTVNSKTYNELNNLYNAYVEANNVITSYNNDEDISEEEYNRNKDIIEECTKHYLFGIMINIYQDKYLNI